MARYWVGGSGTWNTTNTANWSATSGGAGGASVPTSSDDVYIDASSGSGTIIFAETQQALQFLNYSSTITFLGIVDLTLVGNAYLDAVSQNWDASGKITWTGNAFQINSNNKSLANIDLYFNGTGIYSIVAGSWWYARDVYLLSAGTFSTNNNLVCRNFYSTGTASRTLNGQVNVQGNFTASGSGLVATSAVIQLQSSLSATFAGGGFTYGQLNLASFNNATVFTVTGNNTFRSIEDSLQVSKFTLAFEPGSTNTFTTWNLYGYAGSLRTVKAISGIANIVTTQRLTTADYLTFQNINALPGSAWYVGANSTDGGGNTNLIYSSSPTTVDYYWVGGTGTWNATYNPTSWSTVGAAPAVTNWSLSSGGTVSQLSPLSTDNVYFDENSDSGSSFIVTHSSLSVNNFIAQNLQYLMGVAGTGASLYISGNFILPATNLTWGTFGTVTFGWLSGVNTIDTKNVMLGGPIAFNTENGYWQLASPFSTVDTATTTLTKGTLDLQAYTYRTGKFTIFATAAKTIAFGTGNIDLSGSGTIWSGGTTTGLTVTGTPYVTSSYTSTAARTITVGSTTEANSISFWISAGAGTLTLTAASVFKNLSFYGFSGTLANTAITVYGSLTLSPAMTLTAGTAALTLAASSSDWYVTSYGKVLDFPVTFTGTESTFWFLNDALTLGNTRTLSFVSGSIIANSYTISTGLFSSSNSNFRQLVLGPAGGNNILNITGTGTVWNTATTTNLSVGPNAFVTLTNTSATTRTITPGTTSEFLAISFGVFAGSGAFSITASSTIKSLEFSNSFTGSFTIPVITIYGSLIFSTAMTVTGSGAVGFAATSGSWIVRANGKSFGASAPTFGASGSSVAAWTLGSAFTTTGTFTLTSGTFTTSDYTLTANTFSSNNSNVRAINFGNSTVTLSSTSSFVVCNNDGVFAASPNLTFNSGTSTINLTFPSGNVQFFGGGLSYYNVNFPGTVSGTVSLYGTNTFNNLNISGISSAGLKTVSLVSNQVVNGTLTLSAGTNATMRTFVRSDAIGTTRTLTCNAVASLTDIDFRDIAIAGAAAPVSGTRLGDCKGNSGITFNAAKTAYWRATSSANWGATTSSWSLTSGGTADHAAFPLAQDTAVFPAATYPASGSTVTVNAAYNIGTIDMSSRTSNTMTLATGTTTPAIYGNWINGTGTTLTGTGTLMFAGRGSQTITSAGKAFTQAYNISTPEGSVSVQDALVNTGIILSYGYFDAASYNVTAGLLQVGSISSIRAINFGSGTFTVTGSGSSVFNMTPTTNLTVTGTGTISLTSASSKTFAGGGIQTYPRLNQGGTGALTVSGSNKFTNITNTAIGSVLFTGGTTNEFDAFNLNGTSTTVRLTLGSTNATQATLKKPGAWNVGSGSLNNGNNTGLSFTGTNPNYLAVSYINGVVLAASANSNFFAFF